MPSASPSSAMFSASHGVKSRASLGQASRRSTRSIFARFGVVIASPFSPQVSLAWTVSEGRTPPLHLRRGDGNRTPLRFAATVLALLHEWRGCPPCSLPASAEFPHGIPCALPEIPTIPRGTLQFLPPGTTIRIRRRFRKLPRIYLVAVWQITARRREIAARR